jgi:predicted RNase H-like nuclease
VPSRERLLAVGVDGARGGWVAAACFGAGADAPREGLRTELWFDPEIRVIDELRHRQAPRAPLAVDIPIGVREQGGARRCDDAARHELTGSAATVFSPPGRYLLEARDYEEVRRRVARRRAKAADPTDVPGVSAQSAALIPRISDVDQHLRAAPSDDRRASEGAPIFEVHPELCFLRMNRGDPLERKSSARGQLRRLALVEREFPHLREAIELCGWTARGSLIDVLDAYAALWTAIRTARGDEIEVLGEGDRHGGLPAEIRV